MIIQPQCSFLTDSGKCGRPTATVEIVFPGELPIDFDKWGPERKKSFNERPGETYQLVYTGPSGPNGWGVRMDENEANCIIEMFSGEPDIKKIKKRFFDAAGACRECEEFYCSEHWSTTVDGLGTCPKKHEQVFNPFYSQDR